MKICILTTVHAPDDDRIFHKEALSLRKAYDDITIIAPSAAHDNDFRNSGIKLQALRPRSGLLGRLGLIIQALRVLRSLKPDICHFHDFDLILSVPWISRITKAKVIYDVHEVYPTVAASSHRIPRLLRRPAAKACQVAEDIAAARCDLVITVTPALTERFSKLGVLAKTLFNYPQLELFSPVQSGSLPSDAWSGKDIVLYHGMLTQERGFAHMLEGFSLAANTCPNAILVIVGKLESYGKALIDAFQREHELTGKVFHVEWMDHASIPALIRRAKIGLVPFLDVGQLSQSIPIKLFEYLACGVPVIASNLASYRSYIERSGAGILYEAGNTGQLGSAILDLLTREPLRLKMAEQGHLWVRREWNWDRQEAELLSQYKALEFHIN